MREAKYIKQIELNHIFLVKQRNEGGNSYEKVTKGFYTY